MNMIKNLILALSLFAFSQSSFADAACSGRWVNPITDVCWKCLFPMSIGNVKVSSSGLPDTKILQALSRLALSLLQSLNV